MLIHGFPRKEPLFSPGQECALKTSLALLKFPDRDLITFLVSQACLLSALATVSITNLIRKLVGSCFFSSFFKLKKSDTQTTYLLSVIVLGALGGCYGKRTIIRSDLGRRSVLLNLGD